MECTITFKNVAESSSESNNPNGSMHQKRPSRPATANAKSGSYFSLKSPAGLFSHQNRRSYPLSPRKVPTDRSHRVSSSLSSPFGAPSHSFPPAHSPTSRNWQLPNHKHKRSVSILSIESDGGSEKTAASSPFSRYRPTRYHGRSASLHVLPRRNNEDSPVKAGRYNTQQSFLPIDSPVDRPVKANPAAPGISNPGGLAELSHPTARRPIPPAQDFKFPPASPAANGETVSSPLPGKSPVREALALPVPRFTRIISSSSQNGSNRSSGEFYSMSGNSTETLESEYTNYSSAGPRPKPTTRHTRGFSTVEPPGKFIKSQALLMGYAQISASFTVDGSLVNQSAFEEVKRKAVVGTQGSGGVSRNGDSGGHGKSRKSGGLWGALGLDSIEESISSLLSKNSLDGLRDMRGVSSSRSIPLLSTNQSLLFVDLRLAPGEEQSYMFTFTLPRGLPASHKGKAIKISYNLIIGTQRPSGPNEPQRVNRINIPFRVFSGVNGQGEILGHDLMAPHTILHDEAKVQKVGPSSTPYSAKNKSISGPQWKSAPEFLSYVDEILEGRSLCEKALLSPDSKSVRRLNSNDTLATPLSCKDAIDLAILRSNHVQSARSPNRFEISRNGRRVAVVVLNRPAHRLGETVIATVDFEGASLPCYALRAILESSEKVAPTLAVRSEASIYRTTRKVYASCFENTLYSTRVVFTPAIPISATPTILTSGVKLEWELRFEFVTSSNNTTLHEDRGFEPPTTASGAGLLEPISSNDRGTILAALENLPCESFEISIPLTVYGETVRELLPEENDGYPI